MPANDSPSGFDWKSLHDAILEEVAVRYGDRAEVTMRLRPNEAYIKPSRPVVIVSRNLRELSFPSEMPWGPSNFVNSVYEAVLDEGAYSMLYVEMQSGDVIRIRASTFETRIEDDQTGLNVAG